MGYKKLEAKKGAVAIYALLLAVALGLMLTARQCSTKRIGARADDVAGGDTLNVAIEISRPGCRSPATPFQAYITTSCARPAAATASR